MNDSHSPHPLNYDRVAPQNHKPCRSAAAFFNLGHDGCSHSVWASRLPFTSFSKADSWWRREAGFYFYMFGIGLLAVVFGGAIASTRECRVGAILAGAGLGTILVSAFCYIATALPVS